MTDVVVPSIYNSPTYGRLNWEEALAKMVWFMGRDIKASYEVIIGTDSEGINGTSDFVSAIIVHKKGRGGIYFWGRQQIANLHSLKQRIWHEAFVSLNLAQNLVDDFSKMGLLENHQSTLSAPQSINLEIHVDIGPNGKTRELIADIVGMIRANGFKVATKPSSWGASHVADRHV